MKRNSIFVKAAVFVVAFVVGTSMIFAGSTEEVSAATKKPGKVSISKAYSYDYNAVKLTWKKAKNAKKYQVYRATSKSGKYKLVKTTSAKSYVVKGLTTGKKYYFKIRAVNGSKRGAYSAKKPATPMLKTASINSISATENSIKISYGKVNGAKGYQVYRAASGNGTYKKIKSTTACSYTDTDLEPGKVYYYKVRAYRTVNGAYKYGAYSKVVSLKTTQKPDEIILGTPAPSASPYGKGVKITWDSISGASGYKIYSSSTEDGTFELLSSVSANSYINNIGYNKECYYKVQAYASVDGVYYYSKLSPAIYGRSMATEKVKEVDGITFTIKASKTHEELIKTSSGSHYSDTVDMAYPEIDTACPSDNTCQANQINISVRTDKDVDYKDLEYVIDNNRGLVRASHLIDSSGNIVDPEDNIGTYHVVPSWSEPVAEVYAEYRPGMYVEHLVSAYLINKGSFGVKIYYKGILLYECTINNEYVDEGKIKYRESVKDIENKVWTSDMSNHEKLKAIGRYVADTYAYEDVDCKQGAMYVVYAARDLGLDAKYRFRYEDNYDYSSAGTIGGHTSAVVEVDGQWILYDVQGGGFYTVSNDYYD